jgi:hypothetical protein
MEAAAEHLQIGRYTRARAGDVSHRDILELDRIAYQQRDAHNGVMLNELVAALELGITCEEILAVRGAMANTGSYMDLRAEEAQHSKLMEAVAAGIDLADYAWGWPAASHAQLMQARWLLLNVRLYARLRSAHCGHDEALSRCSRER